MRYKTWPVHQPEKHKGYQGADAHQQSGQKPDFFLMFG
jgi:hypothetical protein